MRSLPSIRAWSPRRQLLVLLAVTTVVAGATLIAREAFLADAGQAAHPEYQRLLDRLVTGTGHVAPGVTAYVSGPRGTWTGAAGFADVSTREPMRPDARMRLESVSKAWTATLILQLVGEGRMRLDDTVSRWLPGLLPYGDRITVRQLLNHTSGLIDNNDVGEDPAAYISRVRDPELRAELARVATRRAADPALEFPPRLMVELAAGQPLLSEPGSRYRYSNIGYEIAGMIATRVGGTSLAGLYEQRIIEPLDLTRAAYDPQGEIAGAHPRAYNVDADGRLVDATSWHGGVGAEGGIVADARDEGRFLVALMQGRLLRPEQLAAMKTPPAGIGSAYGLGLVAANSGCAGADYEHNGAGAAYKTSVLVSGDGRRVAVVLANGNRLDDAAYYDAVQETARRLYCAA